MGIADTNLMKAIAQCTGQTLAQIKAKMQKVGDLGIVAEGSRSNQRTMFQPAPLTVPNVYTKLKEIALMTGASVREISIFANFSSLEKKILYFLFILPF